MSCPALLSRPSCSAHKSRQSDRAPSYGPLSVLLLTLPTRSRALRVANLAINTLIFAAAVEFVAYPFFDDAADVVYTRIGAMYPDATKLVVRYPGDSAAHREVRVLWRQADAADSWNNGPVANLTSESDWVATVRLDGLWPSTSYECASACHARTSERAS